MFLWSDYLPLRDYVDKKTACIDSTYPLIFRRFLTGKHEGTGYVNFSLGQILVNPVFLTQGSDDDNFLFTIFLSAHERAHVRYSDIREEYFYAQDLDGNILKDAKGNHQFDILLKDLINILEDERIERLISKNFNHLHDYIVFGNSKMLDTFMLMSPFKGTPDTGEFINYILGSRLSTRSGKPFSPTLHPKNEDLKNRTWHLVEKAFSANSTKEVAKYAREILKEIDKNNVSNLSEAIQSLLSNFGADPSKGDSSNNQSNTKETEAEGVSIKELKELLKQGGNPVSGELQQAQKKAGIYEKEDKHLHKSPYSDIDIKVRKKATVLKSLFSLPKVKKMLLPVESGTKLSVRELIRNKSTPFVEQQDISREKPAHITLLIDDSGSMSGVPEQCSKEISVMFLRAFPSPHKFKAVLTPSGLVVADSSYGEASAAYISGYRSTNGTEYARIFNQEASLMPKDTEVDRYIFLIADGESHDQEELAKGVKKARKNNIHCFGLGVGLGQGGEDYFKRVFDKNYVSVTDSAKLTVLMEKLMKNVVYNRKKKAYGL